MTAVEIESRYQPEEPVISSRKRSCRRLRYHMQEETKNVTLASLAGKIEEMMYAAARVHQDRGRQEYKADMHRSAVAYAMSKAFADGLPLNATNIVGLLAMLDNHSAWRQRFEKKGIFPKASARPKSAVVDDYLAELSDEGV